MKWTFATAGLIIIGLFGIIIILLFHEITVSNEQDYYTLKEATEASMIEAVDSTYYRLTGKIKMSEEKFVENFTKRFVQTSTYGQGNYYIDFYQITEYPAKVSLRIIDETNSYNIYTTFDESLEPTKAKIVNELSAILDGYEIEDEYDIITYELDHSDLNTESGAPVVNGCQAKQPHYRCLKHESYTNTLASSGRYAVSSPQYDVARGTCHFSVWVSLQDGEDWVSDSFKTESGRAEITCDDGYRLNTSTGWCECK